MFKLLETSKVYPDHFVRECWKCGHALTHEHDDLIRCPVCEDDRLVPFGTRFNFVQPEW